MKNKGFTLIELLAVIVILAIIALIAVPIILNIISDTKKSASKRSVELYLDAVNKAIARYSLKDEFPDTTCTIEDNGNLSCLGLDIDEEILVEMNGTVPIGGYLTFVNSKLNSGKVNYTEESYTYSDGSATIVESTPTDSSCFETEETTIVTSYSATSSCPSVFTAFYNSDIKDEDEDELTEEQAILVCNGQDPYGMMSIFVNYQDFVDYMVDNNALIVTEKSGMAITGYNCNDTEIVIPSKLDGKTVIAIGESAFNNKGLTSVELPNTVVSVLGDSENEIGAFSNNNISNLVLGSNIISIGEYAFYNNALTSVFLPGKLKSIGAAAFGQNEITSIIIPNSVETVSVGAFVVNKITRVKLSNNLIVIPDHMFDSNSIESVKIPDGVTVIGEQAFARNKLTSIEIPNSVEEIGRDAFNFNNLTSVVIGNSITSIADGAFSGDVWSANNTTYGPNALTRVKIDRQSTDVELGAGVFGWANQLDNLSIKWSE